MSTPPPDDLLDRTLLRQLAGEKGFRQGEEYFQKGAVRQVQVAGDRISAKVSGSRAYRVKLWRGRGQLQFSCNCDRGDEQEFCKHCVAVGLAWLAGPEGQTAKPGVTRDELRDHLRGLDKERLINLALEAMDFDDILRRRLMLETIGVTRPRKGAELPALPNLATYRQILREAIECADYVDYEAMGDYTQGVEEAIRPLADLLRSGQAAAVVDLAEFALIELDKANDMLDGGDGSLNAVYDDLQQCHLEACRLAHLDPEALAARLLEFELEGGLGVFNNTAAAYAEVLGEAGLRAWRRLLTEAWQGLPAPGAGAEEIDHRRFQINALMERLAGETGDLDALAAVRQRDLTSAHDFVALAEMYRAAGRLDQAIAWAEKGLAAGEATVANSGLRNFLASAYRQAGRQEDAIRVAWEQLEQDRDLESFGQLKTVAAGDWPHRRDRALALLRGAAPTSDHSLVVEALLGEGLIEEAWTEAKASGCRVRLWLTLADRRANTAPADALRIYQDQLNSIIAGSDQRAYRQAIDVLAKIRALLEKLGRREDFGALSAEVRAAHRQKRNFLKLLDGMR